MDFQSVFLPMNDEKVRLMLDETESNSDCEDENDSDVEDFVEFKIEEKEIHFDNGLEENYEQKMDIPQFTSDDHHNLNYCTKWNKAASSLVEEDCKNFITEQSEVKDEAKGFREPGEIWKLFFSDKVITLITKSTNEQLRNAASQFGKHIDCCDTDEVEILAFLGLLIFAGVHKNYCPVTKDLFKTDGSVPEIFRLNMGWHRFHQLMRCLRFNDKETRMQCASEDKFAPIRELFEEVTASFKKYYSASKYVAIDENLITFKGRCSFTQHVKPNKDGIKIYTLIDTKVLYTVNMEVYLGNQPFGPYLVDNSPKAMVLRLTEVIHNTGRNITFNDFCTDFSLVDLLKQEHNLTVIGPVKKNSTEIPREFIHITNRAEKSAIFASQNQCTILSYVPKKNTNILLVSSTSNTKIHKESGKPELLMHFEATKGSAETLSKMCEVYNIARNTRRWPMVIFYHLMNVVGINSFIIYAKNNPNKNINRRKFLTAVSYDLFNDHLRRRAQSSGLPRSLKQRLAEICKLDGPESSITANNSKLGRCFYCSAKKNRKTRFNCLNCKNYFCLEHAVMICPDCHCNASFPT